METLESMPLRRRSIWDKLLEVADVASLSKEERDLYDIALKHYRDYNNTIDYAKEEGWGKGRNEDKREANMLAALNLKKKVSTS